MPTTVPTPARASASYMSFGPDVPPVILQNMRPQRESRDPTIMRGPALHLAASRNSGSPISASTTSPRRLGSVLPNRSAIYAWTMLSAAECTLNSGISSSLAASTAWLWLTPCIPLRASCSLGAMIDSATFIGTPAAWNMSDCIDMTFGNSTLDAPSG